MIKLRKRKSSAPEIMLSPMIDMIFLLLVFFILSTMYMSELKTIPVKLPIASQTQIQTKVKYNVTIKKDGSYWLGEKAISKEKLLASAKSEIAKNKDFAVILRADSDVKYNVVIGLLDDFKKVGVSRVGLAAEKDAAKK